MEKSVCALGFFDGVHEAHSQILSRTASYAKELGLKSVALTFEKSPAEFFGKKIKYLTSLPQKKELMQNLGIDHVEVLFCNENTLNLSPQAFVDDILVHKLHAAAVFCGFNYTFGKNASGDVAVLKDLCEKRGIRVFAMDRLSENGVTVSSSEIRLALSKGDISLANLLLTRPFEIRGVVEEGKKLGRKLNFPTANIYPENFPDLPHGVYATKTTIDKKEYLSVTNIGTNPTVGDTNLRIETFIIDFSDEIYNQTIAVKFYKLLRHEQNFESIDALKSQIAIDTQNAILHFSQASS